MISTRVESCLLAPLVDNNYRLPRTISFKPVQLIIHSANEIPDEDNTPATSMDVDIGKVVNVGVEVSITNITTNFAEMKESKRQCHLNIDEDATYSRNKCRMEQVGNRSSKDNLQLHSLVSAKQCVCVNL